MWPFGKKDDPPKNDKPDRNKPGWYEEATPETGPRADRGVSDQEEKSWLNNFSLFNSSPEDKKKKDKVESPSFVGKLFGNRARDELEEREREKLEAQKARRRPLQRGVDYDDLGGAAPSYINYDALLEDPEERQSREDEMLFATANAIREKNAKLAKNSAVADHLNRPTTSSRLGRNKMEPPLPPELANAHHIKNRGTIEEAREQMLREQEADQFFDEKGRFNPTRDITKRYISDPQREKADLYKKDDGFVRTIDTNTKMTRYKFSEEQKKKLEAREEEFYDEERAADEALWSLKERQQRRELEAYAKDHGVDISVLEKNKESNKKFHKFDISKPDHPSDLPKLYSKDVDGNPTGYLAGGVLGAIPDRLPPKKKSDDDLSDATRQKTNEIQQNEIHVPSNRFLDGKRLIVVPPKPLSPAEYAKLTEENKKKYQQQQIEFQRFTFQKMPWKQQELMLIAQWDKMDQEQKDECLEFQYLHLNHNTRRKVKQMTESQKNDFLREKHLEQQRIFLSASLELSREELEKQLIERPDPHYFERSGKTKDQQQSNEQQQKQQQSGDKTKSSKIQVDDDFIDAAGDMSVAAALLKRDYSVFVQKDEDIDDPTISEEERKIRKAKKEALQEAVRRFNERRLPNDQVSEQEFLKMQAEIRSLEPQQQFAILFRQHERQRQELQRFQDFQLEKLTHQIMKKLLEEDPNLQVNAQLLLKHEDIKGMRAQQQEERDLLRKKQDEEHESLTKYLLRRQYEQDQLRLQGIGPDGQPLGEPEIDLNKFEIPEAVFVQNHKNIYDHEIEQMREALLKEMEEKRAERDWLAIEWDLDDHMRQEMGIVQEEMDQLTTKSQFEAYLLKKSFLHYVKTGVAIPIPKIKGSDPDDDDDDDGNNDGLSNGMRGHKKRKGKKKRDNNNNNDSEGNNSDADQEDNSYNDDGYDDDWEIDDIYIHQDPNKALPAGVLLPYLLKYRPDHIKPVPVEQIRIQRANIRRDRRLAEQRRIEQLEIQTFFERERQRRNALFLKLPMNEFPKETNHPVVARRHLDPVAAKIYRLASMFLFGVNVRWNGGIVNGLFSKLTPPTPSDPILAEKFKHLKPIYLDIEHRELDFTDLTNYYGVAAAIYNSDVMPIFSHMLYEDPSLNPFDHPNITALERYDQLVELRRRAVQNGYNTESELVQNAEVIDQREAKRRERKERRRRGEFNDDDLDDDNNDDDDDEESLADILDDEEEDDESAKKAKEMKTVELYKVIRDGVFKEMQTPHPSINPLLFPDPNEIEITHDVNNFFNKNELSDDNNTELSETEQQSSSPSLPLKKQSTASTTKPIEETKKKSEPKLLMSDPIALQQAVRDYQERLREELKQQHTNQQPPDKIKQTAQQLKQKGLTFLAEPEERRRLEREEEERLRIAREERDREIERFKELQRQKEEKKLQRQQIHQRAQAIQKRRADETDDEAPLYIDDRFVHSPAATRADALYWDEKDFQKQHRHTRKAFENVRMNEGSSLGYTPSPIDDRKLKVVGTNTRDAMLYKEQYLQRQRELEHPSVYTTEDGDNIPMKRQYQDNSKRRFDIDDTFGNWQPTVQDVEQADDGYDVNDSRFLTFSHPNRFGQDGPQVLTPVVTPEGAIAELNERRFKEMVKNNFGETSSATSSLFTDGETSSGEDNNNTNTYQRFSKVPVDPNAKLKANPLDWVDKLTAETTSPLSSAPSQQQQTPQGDNRSWLDLVWGSSSSEKK